jgi:glycosyltransferase involved in cell wall biosynthesis
MEVIKVCHLSSVHLPYDSRIFEKEAISTAKFFEAYLVALNWETQTRENVRIIGVPYRPESRLKRALIGGYKLYQEALRVDAHIYHIHDPELIPYVFLLKRKGKKVVFDAHEDLPLQIFNKHYIPKRFKKIISKLVSFGERVGLRKADHIVTSTPSICAKFQSLGFESTAICNYPKLNPSLIANSNPQKDVVYIGGISLARGIKTIASSMEMVRAKRPQTSFYFAGISHPAHLATTIFEAYQESNSIHYLGILNRAGVNELLSDCKVGLVTLPYTKAFYESLPIKMFEYMEAGIPVIASHFPFWKSIIEKYNCGLCVDPADPLQIAEAIIYLLDNPEIAQQMGKNGHNAIVSQFNWLNEEQKLIRVYKKLLETP